MKTLILNVDESQEAVIMSLVKYMQISYEAVPFLTEEQENQALGKAIEEGKNSGLLNETEKKDFLDWLNQ